MLTKRNAVAFKVFLMVLSLACFAGCKPPGPKALLDGNRLLEKGQPEAAAARLEVATQLMSTNANAWNYLGIAYHQAGQRSNAVVAYKRALTVDPDLVETRLNLGSLWLELGQPADAKSEFTAYNLRRPNAPEGFGKIALAEMHLRETAAAEQHIRKSLQLNDKSPDAWNTLGLIQLQQRKAREAARSFASALQLEPDFVPALFNLAVVTHQQLGDRAGALKIYRQYLALKPRPADADAVAVVVARLEQELKPVPRTSPVLVKQMPAAPAPAPVARTVSPVTTSAPTPPVPAPPAPAPQPMKPPTNSTAGAKIQPAKQASNLVRTTVEPDIKVAPVVDVPPQPVIVATSPASRVPAPATAPAIASAPAQNGRDASPGSSSANPVQRSPRKSGVTPLPPPRNKVLVESTTATEVVGDGAGGADETRTGDRVTADRFAVKGNKAMIAKRYVEAADAYHAAAKADPGWYQAHFNHAAAAIEAGRTAEAIGACEKALALKPDSPEARYNYALALRQAGRISDAASQLERVLVAKPEDARTHLTLGNLFADQLRQPGKARLHYLKVLEINSRHPQAGAIHFWLTANPAP